jgi:glycosyltransferase involved in cell wall biosynthesis
MNQRQTINLFVDAHVFDDEFQGSRTFLKEIYSIIARKEGIRLYLAAYDTENLKHIFPPEDNLVFLKYRSRSGWLRLFFDIPAMIRKHKIDYAHFQYITPPVKNCRHIVTIHDVIFKDYPDEFSLPYRMLKKLLYKTSALRSDLITTVSEFSKESIEKFLHTGKRPVYVIPNGVHPRFFEPYRKEESKRFVAEKYGFDKFILFVSRIEPRKNHIFLLKAYLELELHLKGYQLVLLGHESIPVPGFDEMLDGLPPDIRKYIFKSRDIDDEDLLEIYRAAALFVYPSKAEGFGIPPLEAAALKIPVLCSNTSAMKDFAFFGENHFDPYDYELFREKLKNILDLPPATAFLEQVAGVIRQEYSWGRSADKLFGLLAQDKKSVT